LNSPPVEQPAKAPLSDLGYCGSSDASQLLADLQLARVHLNRAIDLLPSLTVGDENRRRVEAHLAVLKVRLMQLLEDL
jgi:hypothetical protein